MSDALSHEQIANNQASFRRANERIEAAADSKGLMEPFPFICECADLNCEDPVHLTIDEYEDVRQHSRRFFTLPGHHRRAEELLLEEHDDYFVVEKVGVAGEMADESYRRLSD